MNNNRLSTLSLLLLLSHSLWGQQLHEGYIDWGASGKMFSSRYWNWVAGQPYTADDNFFISRVRPKQRFRDPLTQVNPELTEQNDKRLCWWMPIGTVPNNALPDGVFDRDVFSMWQYVTHFGNWTASMARVPGALTDVAHKNGVSVSATASIPYGNLATDWRTNLQDIIDVGASQMADFLQYYGIDGLGYNSEFSTSNAKFLNSLLSWHQTLNSLMKKRNPLFEIVWYDGTSGYGNIYFDQGLGDHNVGTFGKGGAERANLFLNYNWNKDGLLKRSVDYAEKIGRNPLDIYCGFNLQGREPRSGERWPLLKDYPVSIGLWGAHNENMFYESRGERGYSPLMRQQTYQLRQEMWFTNGSRNPIDKHEISNSMRYDTDNTDFFGMSAMMSARSSLSWNLSEEPFVTSFSLGNGTAYYWHGTRTSSHEWYNIGTQDYLPTWRWWWTDQLLSRTPSLNQAAAPSLNQAATPSLNQAWVKATTAPLSASFSWEDAWNGGSCLEITGSDEGSQVLHLFKTQFSLQPNDRLSLILKRTSGDARVWLVLTDAEGTTERALLYTDDGNEWTANDFRISSHFPQMAGKTLRLIALEIEGADSLQLRLGHLSLQRADHPQPLAPVVERTEILSRHAEGCDGKIIWQMPNDFFEDEVCYNIDVLTSLFHLYAQVEGSEPILMSSTTSWAGMFYGIPLPKEGGRVRLGVSAVGLDMVKESDISWGEWQNVGKYEGEEATVPDDSPSGNITPLMPKILSMKEGAEGSNRIYYTAVNSDGDFSRAIDLNEYGFGVRCADITEQQPSFFSKSFSVTCWVRPNQYFYDTQLLNIRDKTDSWSKTDWGFFWHIVTAKGKHNAFTLRGKNDTQSYDIPELQLSCGAWHHLAYVFDFETTVPEASPSAATVPEASPSAATVPEASASGKTVTVRLYVDGKQLSGQPSLQLSASDLYGWRQKNVLAIGGSMFSAAGLNGYLDDFRLYDCALTDQDAQQLANGEECPTQPACLWDFESEGPSAQPATPASQPAAPSLSHTWLNIPAAPTAEFLSKGKLTGIPAFLHRYISSEKEGEGTFITVPANTAILGAPRAPGNTFHVLTADEWLCNDAAVTLLESTNTAALIESKNAASHHSPSTVPTPDTSHRSPSFMTGQTATISGSALFGTTLDGLYDITLKRTNIWGTDSMTLRGVSLTTLPSSIKGAQDNAEGTTKPQSSAASKQYDLHGRQLPASSTPRIYIQNHRKRIRIKD